MEVLSILEDCVQDHQIVKSSVEEEIWGWISSPWLRKEGWFGSCNQILHQCKPALHQMGGVPTDADRVNQQSTLQTENCRIQIIYMCLLLHILVCFPPVRSDIIQKKRKKKGEKHLFSIWRKILHVYFLSCRLESEKCRSSTSAIPQARELQSSKPSRLE